jgi:serine phosphatase RsbU (regulator of sigma subunit)
MLPRLIPQLPHVEIAAYMKTATEVGGDYYDFHVGSNGELTIAIGDATGHGLKAGTIVSATKSLFNHLASQSDLAATLEQTSSALKLMNLRSLFMALKPK